MFRTLGYILVPALYLLHYFVIQVYPTVTWRLAVVYSTRVVLYPYRCSTRITTRRRIY